MKLHLKLFSLLVCLLCSMAVHAITEDDLMRLEAEMLNYISSSERDSFTTVSNRLKEAAKEAGNERLFYKAWSKQAVFEAMHQNFARAEEIARDLSSYAQNDGPVGQYYAAHTKATILMHKDDYAGAEQAYLKALSIRHQNFPKESAAEDLRELLKLAYLRGDNETAKRYANQLLAEPNLAPHHKGRTLYRLCQMAFEEDDVEEYNHIYEEMKRLMQTRL